MLMAQNKDQTEATKLAMFIIHGSIFLAMSVPKQAHDSPRTPGLFEDQSNWPNHCHSATRVTDGRWNATAFGARTVIAIKLAIQRMQFPMNLMTHLFIMVMLDFYRI